MRGPSAVVFDLDDTLFPQSSWLDGAWRVVADAAAASHGVPPDAFEHALRTVAAEGTAKGGIIDRALVAVGRDDVDPGPLVDRFRSHRPVELTPAPGAIELLSALGSTTRLGLITDGDAGIQRGKVAALGIAGYFDAIVYSDELGREHRKPDAAPFLAALRLLGLEASQAVYVGDNPAKDVAGARGVGMLTVRVRTGEYAADDGAVPADLEADDLIDVGRLLLPTLVP